MGWVGTITNAGDAMITQIAGGDHTLTIVGATAGTGTRNVADLAAATALVSEKGAITIAAKQQLDDCVKVRARITPLSTSFTAKEIGIWAKVDNGERTLFSIHQNTDGVSVPASGDDPNFIFDLICTYALSITDNFSVTVDTSAVATTVQLEAAVAGMLKYTEQELTDAQIAQAKENLVLTDDDIMGENREKALTVANDSSTWITEYPSAPGIYRTSISVTGLPSGLPSFEGTLIIIESAVNRYTHLYFHAGGTFFYGNTDGMNAPSTWRKCAIRSNGYSTAAISFERTDSGAVFALKECVKQDDVVHIAISLTNHTTDNKLYGVWFNLPENFRPLGPVYLNGSVYTGGGWRPVLFKIFTDGNFTIVGANQSDTATNLKLAGTFVST